MRTSLAAIALLVLLLACAGSSRAAEPPAQEPLITRSYTLSVVARAGVTNLAERPDYGDPFATLLFRFLGEQGIAPVSIGYMPAKDELTVHATRADLEKVRMGT